MTNFKTALFGTLAAAATLAAVAAPPAIGETLKIKRLNPQLGQQIELAPGVRQHLQDSLRSRCVDLAVFVTQRRAHGDRVRVTYGVKNVSTIDYVSGANQQAIVLSRHGSEVGVGRFAQLNAGQSASWSVIVRRPFEIPHTYKAVFSHDPDLFIDGNEMNDDCNRANNSGETLVTS